MRITNDAENISLLSTERQELASDGEIGCAQREKLFVATIGVTIIYEWDDAKNRANIRKHGFHFAQAEEMFGGFLLIRPDTREDYGEERWIGIGMIQGRCAFVAFAPRARDAIRIISLRKANNEEREEYEKALRDGLETY